MRQNASIMIEAPASAGTSHRLTSLFVEEAEPTGG
jgi:hypothetical protein